MRSPPLVHQDDRVVLFSWYHESSRDDRVVSLSRYHGSSPRTHSVCIRLRGLMIAPYIRLHCSTDQSPSSPLTSHLNELYRSPMDPASGDGVFIPAAFLPLVKDLLGIIGVSLQLQWYRFLLSFWRPGVYMWRHDVYSVRILDPTGAGLYCTRIYSYI